MTDSVPTPLQGLAAHLRALAANLEASFQYAPAEVYRRWADDVDALALPAAPDDPPPLPTPLGIVRMSSIGKPADLAQSEQDAEMWAYDTECVYSAEQMREYRALGRVSAPKAHMTAGNEGIESDTDNSAWYCESHPEFFMGHDGCDGAGILGSARIGMLVQQRRRAEQNTREANMARDDLASRIRLSFAVSAPPVPPANLGDLISATERYAAARSLYDQSGVSTPEIQEQTLAVANNARSELIALFSRSAEGGVTALLDQPVAAEPEHIGFIYPDDLATLRREGEAAIYLEPQEFVFLPKQDPIALYASPLPAPQQPPSNDDFRVTIAAIFEAVGYSEEYALRYPKEKASVTFKRWFDEQIAAAKPEQVGVASPVVPPEDEEPWGIRDDEMGFLRTFRTEYARDQFYMQARDRYVKPELFGPATPADQSGAAPSTGDALLRQVESLLLAVGGRLAHKVACYSARPTTEWAEHGSVSFASCCCEVKEVDATLAAIRSAMAGGAK